MFAGAAREAVFSNPNVIRRINADFVPVALKAGLVQNPPDDEEGRLYREIGRSMLAPQGICVVNSVGKVLAWTMAFDDDKSVLAFLGHIARRFAQFPDAKKPVAAERYGRFPSQKGADLADNGKVLAVPDRHPDGKSCPAKPRMQHGTIVARVFGRALDADGNPMADTVRQEHYVEDRFNIPVAMQEALATALADAGTERFRLADDVALLLVSHAFLGQLDVNPLGGAHGGKGTLKQCEIWAKAERGGNGPVRLRIDGKSEAVGDSSEGQNGGDGRLWQHEVKLTWDGIIEMKDKRVSRVLLVARGSEKLKWGNTNLPKLKDQADLALLVAGHAIDLSCGVRYGIIGEPVAADEAGVDDASSQRTINGSVSSPAGAPTEGPPQVPDEARKQMIQMLGGPFIVFRDKVQEELEISHEQKQKLLERFSVYVQETIKVFQSLGDKKPEERDKELQSYRQKAQEKLVLFLKETLKDESLKRLRQLELQQEGAVALFTRPDLGKELKITDEQRQQFMAVLQEQQKKIEPLMKEAQSGGNPQEIMPKIMKIRKEQESRIEAMLSDTQKKQWKEMRGKPFDLGD